MCRRIFENAIYMYIYIYIYITLHRSWFEFNHQRETLLVHLVSEVLWKDLIASLPLCPSVSVTPSTVQAFSLVHYQEPTCVRSCGPWEYNHKMLQLVHIHIEILHTRTPLDNVMMPVAKVPALIRILVTLIQHDFLSYNSTLLNRLCLLRGHSRPVQRPPLPQSRLGVTYIEPSQSFVS